jgi:hypothetical protein
MHKFLFENVEGDYYCNIESSLGVLRLNNSNSVILERGDMDRLVELYQKERVLSNFESYVSIYNTVNSTIDMIHIKGQTSKSSNGSIISVKNLAIETEGLSLPFSNEYNIDLRISLNAINDKYVDTACIHKSKLYAIKKVGVTNVINPYNIKKTLNSTDKYSVFYIENKLARYDGDNTVICDKFDSYSYKDLINKTNEVEGIALSNDKIMRGRGFFLKVKSSRAKNETDLGRILNNMGGINIVFPLQEVIYPVESLDKCNIKTYYGGTIIRNLDSLSLSYFYKTIR